jgi:hypothetical protein
MMLRITVCTGLVIMAAVAHAAPKQRPATALVITNARAEAATTVAVSAGDQTVALQRPLAPKASATLKLPRMAGCSVAVAATFADESVVDLEDFDVCKEKSIRFTD